MSTAKNPKRGYAALARFLDGYLHQDFKAEHEDAAGAARAFARDAKPAEVAKVVAQLRAFRSWADDVKTETWRERLAALGGAYWPRSPVAFTELAEAMERAAARES